MSFLHDDIIILTILHIIVYYLRQRKEEEAEKEKEKVKKEEKEEGEEEYGERGEDSSSSLRHLSCRRFSLDNIKLATNNFDESLVIGEGGFGKVYKGIIHAGADAVAIKRLSFNSSQGVPEFRRELELLSKFRHSHLVSLIGYCEACPERILVYEYMPAGSFSDHLHESRRVKSGHSLLSWVHRLNICIDAARGLDYLHTGTGIKERVIHCDVKSSNILLDEHFAAKVSDFGLSRIAPVNTGSINCDLTNRNIGTVGYIDLESFYSGRVTRKSDVFAFGVVLFEALCGRPAVDKSLDYEQRGLAVWARNCVKEGTINQIIDPFLRGKILPGCLDEFVQIAYKCLHDRSKNRPTMAYVVARLESALAIQEGRDVVARVESGLALQEGNFTKHVRKMRFTRKMWSLFTQKHPKLTAVSAESSTLEVEEMNVTSTTDFLQYNLSTIKAATGGFSTTNKLGEGGFGWVYKGELQNGIEIAVKRMSSNSIQGELEFKNEVMLVARLQHRNLVRLLGFCLEGAERLLIYEFVPNASLDIFIFDPIKCATLDWDRRYKIIKGIARGLLYLHEDSRLNIIHRDLKASNVLLDADMNAKIADFGMARLFTQEETQGNTSRIVGTFGYLAPEYLMHGQFSVKSDVFSFGVLLLEIVTGQNNHCFRNGEVVEDLVSHAWKSWRDGTCSTIIDPILRNSSCSSRDMMRSIHIGLLCVQDNVVDRPTMASVVLMLSSSSLTLPVASEPAFFMHSSIDPEISLLDDISNSSEFSELKGRSGSSKSLSGRSSPDKHWSLFSPNLPAVSTESSTLEEGSDEAGEMNYYNLTTMQDATDNFSSDNKLGEGGFGPVYWGKLDDGKEIAVKRLCKNSRQGLEEFKTEVKLIIKLQHKNLVRLLGCCIEGNERLLVYEYMPNNSVDAFLFDPTKCKELNWPRRANIGIGIAKGLRHLHEDSRLKIIHRDMKASNVLLDHEMNPKISDFGTARIFGVNQIDANTSKIVGTYGYMAPEYTMMGLFSIKSDVYSFGVLLLEMISGKRNNGFYNQEHRQNLLSYAWRLLRDGKGEKLIDQNLIDECPVNEALRWIQIALLCVQEDPKYRPTMSSVVFMLESQSTSLAEPREPTFL